MNMADSKTSTQQRSHHLPDSSNSASFGEPQTLNQKKLQPFDEQVHDLEESLEHGPLRVLGYAGRIGRLASTVLAKGSRYAALSFDVGESFKSVVDQKWVNAGYGIAIAYVAIDVALATEQAYRKGEDEKREAAQKLTFQLFGSLILPSLAIHQVVHFSEKSLANTANANVRKWGPVVAGLALLPLMPVVIDEPVEHAVHWAFEKYWPTQCQATK